jgi:RimJ/RimL family protein N-acetyltransferase
MEPVEINAGRCYLRAFRADDLLDDRVALVEAFGDEAMRTFVRQFRVDTIEDADNYIATRAREWENNERASWAIAEPTTGFLLGEVGLKNLSPSATAVPEAAIWVHPVARKRGIGEAALSAVVRFGFGALELSRIDYVCDDANTASAALAARCGFTHVGPTTTPDGAPAQRWTLTND